LFFALEFVRDGCHGAPRDTLEEICMKLPEEECISEPDTGMNECGRHEFDCGNGQCIPGLGICDTKYHCMNGADELKW